MMTLLCKMEISIPASPWAKGHIKSKRAKALQLGCVLS